MVTKLSDHGRVLVAAVKKPPYPEMVGNIAVVSDSLIKDGVFTTTQVWRVNCQLNPGEQFNRDLPGLPYGSLLVEHLDEHSVAKPGSTLTFRSILVGKTREVTSPDEFTAEELMMRAVFGEKNPVRDVSDLYHFRDQGLIISVVKKPPTVTFEILIKRSLCVGDILEDSHGNKIVVGKIVQDEEIPTFQGEVVEILVSTEATITQNLRAKGFLFRNGKKLPKGSAQKLRMRKITLNFEDKVTSRSSGPSSKFTDLPVSAPGVDEGQLVSTETVIALAGEGFVRNLHEMVTIKSDCERRKVEAFVSLVQGDPISLDHPNPLTGNLPENTGRLIKLLQSLAIQVEFDSSKGQQKIYLNHAGEDEVLRWSYGEVTSGEALIRKGSRYIDKETGLLSQKIFGPMKDYHCACGKYKRVRYKGVICDKCGVEVSSERVRKERMGHITLSAPVVHPWYINWIAQTLGVEVGELQLILSYQKSTIMGFELEKQGAFWVKKALEEKGVNTDGIVLTTIPVLPAGLRPFEPIPNTDRFLTSDLNQLYRFLIHRSNQLQRLIELGAPSIIQSSVYVALQRAFENLIGNLENEESKSGTNLTEILERAIRTCSNKRVEYSGSFIPIPDYSLTPGTISIPLQAATELFRPSILRMLVTSGFVHNITAANKLLSRTPNREEVTKAVEEVAKTKEVLLITPDQKIGVFRLVLTRDEAMHLHPDDASKLGLTFDGRKVSIHDPISKEALEELQHPQPIVQTSSVIRLSARRIMEGAIAKEVITLTPLDKILLSAPI